MDFWKEWWVQAGSCGALVSLLAFACWTLWQRYCKIIDADRATSAEFAAAAERFRATQESVGKSLDGNTEATRQLSIAVARWGGRGSAA